MSTAKKNDKRRDKPYLEQTGGAGRGRTFELSRDMLRIGRTEDNEIVMKSDSVSRTHAHLKRTMNGDWFFQDNSSKNGIRVNGKRVLEARLSDGDVLGVGDFTFKFFEATPSAEQESASEKTSPALAYVPIPPPSPAWKTTVDRLTLYAKLAGTYLPKIVTYLEQNSWAAGLLVGVLIGGGLWWKSSRIAPRPGAITLPTVTMKAPPPAPAAIAPVPPEPAPREQASTETNPTPVAEPAPAQPTVSREDLSVAKASKKPKSDIRDLKVYLREGREYLKEGDKESAAIAFRFALVLEPNNKEARQGLKAAGGKVESVAPPKAPAPAVVKEERKSGSEAKHKAKVADFMKGAVEAYNRRSYQEAIDKAEAARKIELPGQTEYLNEAKQIIDRARLKQKEDFEPFLESARKKLQEGDFKASAALCDEMLRTDPAYAPARECLAKSLDGIAGKRLK